MKMRDLLGSASSVLLALGVPSACTEFADADDIAVSNAELPNTPGEGDGASEETGAWSCLGATPAPPPDALGNTSVTYTILIVDTVSREPPPGLVVTACSPLDIECASPVVSGVRPDADGFIRVRVPSNFSGFFSVTSDNSVPSVLFFDGALTEDVTATPMLVIGQVAFQALAQNQGVSLDPQMGHLLLRAYDCDRNLTPGVRFTADRGGQPYAFVDGLPVVGQTATDAQGTAGFLNVLPGLTVVQGVRVDDGVVIRTASGRVRAGWFTYVDLVPPH